MRLILSLGPVFLDLRVWEDGADVEEEVLPEEEEPEMVAHLDVGAETETVIPFGFTPPELAYRPDYYEE